MLQRGLEQLKKMIGLCKLPSTQVGWVGHAVEKQSTAVGSLIQQCGVRSEKRAMQATLPCAATTTDPFRQVELPCVECGC